MQQRLLCVCRSTSNQSDYWRGGQRVRASDPPIRYINMASIVSPEIECPSCEKSPAPNTSSAASCSARCVMRASAEPRDKRATPISAKLSIGCGRGGWVGVNILIAERYGVGWRRRDSLDAWLPKNSGCPASRPRHVGAVLAKNRCQDVSSASNTTDK